MRVNLGCGYNKKGGFINVDNDPNCEPDVLFDLDSGEAWPFEDNSVECLVAEHCLEHCGATTQQWFHIIKEMYRVCAPNASIYIRVPHPQHDVFSFDCTHVRAIYPQTFSMFDVQRNKELIESGDAESKLGIRLGVNFRLDKVQYVLDPMIQEMMNNNEMSEDDVKLQAKFGYNVIMESCIELTVIKSE